MLHSTVGQLLTIVSQREPLFCKYDSSRALGSKEQISTWTRLAIVPGQQWCLLVCVSAPALSFASQLNPHHLSLVAISPIRSARLVPLDHWRSSSSRREFHSFIYYYIALDTLPPLYALILHATLPLHSTGRSVCCLAAPTHASPRLLRLRLPRFLWSSPLFSSHFYPEQRQRRQRVYVWAHTHHARTATSLLTQFILTPPLSLGAKKDKKEKEKKNWT